MLGEMGVNESVFFRSPRRAGQCFALVYRKKKRKTPLGVGKEESGAMVGCMYMYIESQERERGGEYVCMWDN